MLRVFTLSTIIGFLFVQKLLAQDQKSTASPQVSTFMITSKELGGERKIWMYLPKDYKTSNKKYPVLYMHDAQNLFDAKTSFAGEWSVDETLDSLNAKVIVVGIEHGNDQRLAELTPYANEKYGGGKADQYLSFLVNTLKPYIDENYRTKSNKKNTAIMGSSLGGLVSFYAVMKYPKVFSKAGIFSPSFWFSDKIYALANSQKKICANMYFLCGENEDETMVSDMDKMIAIVHEKGMDQGKDYIRKTVPNGKHNEKLWRDNFAKAYLYFFNK